MRRSQAKMGNHSPAESCVVHGYMRVSWPEYKEEFQRLIASQQNAVKRIHTLSASNTQKRQQIMKGPVFLLVIIVSSQKVKVSFNPIRFIKGLQSVTSLPGISIDEQTKKCFSAFYRCCSSETEIPQRFVY